MKFHYWIRRRESPMQKAAYTFAKGLVSADFPVIPLVHAGLAAERQFRKGLLTHLVSKIYYEPLLRRRAQVVGKNLVLYEDIPKIFGNLSIELGDRVTLSGKQVWFACGDETPKLLKIGTDSYVGFATEIFSGSRVVIGQHVLIANHVLINGYDGHPLDPIARAAGAKPLSDGVGPVEIGDYAWIGSKAIILKNVVVGRGAIVASGSVVTKNVPDLTVVAGNPAQEVKRINPPRDWDLPNLR
jgi:acetyltransferase-like isoleucine patch superfamily enzyme